MYLCTPFGMSNNKNIYAIAHIGLKKDIHLFELELDDTFFLNADQLAVHAANIHVQISLDKRNTPYILDFLINGSITTDCDKCAAKVILPIIGKYTVYIKFSDEVVIEDSADDDILVIHRDDPEIDYYPFLHDFVHLCLPISKICDDPGNTEYCDIEVVNILNSMNQAQQQEQNTIWSKLEQLKNIK